MTEEDLIEILKELTALPQETEWVEFKVNKAIPQNIGDYISGLSNAACLENKEHAYLVFGVEDAKHTIVGTRFNPETEKVKGQELDNWLRTQLDPRTDFRFFSFTHKGHPIVLCQIDAAINQPVRFRNKASIRVGSYLKELKDHPEKESKIWRKVKNLVFEEEIAKRNLTSEKVLELLKWEQLFKLLNLPKPSSFEVIIEKLIEEKLVIHRNKKYSITNLGAILFANDLSQFDDLERKAPRVIIYKGNNKLETIKEQTGKFGFAVGFAGMLQFINDRLPSNEVIGKVFREEVTMFPELAIRELVANAVIHQDFSIKGAGTMIEIFDNRIEITNPGKPLISTDRFIDHSPISRNEKLAYLMRRMNFCEERGSGIDKVIVQVEVFQLPAPIFMSEENFTRVILLAPKTLRQMDKMDKIRATYQHCCIKYVTGDHMTNQSLRERFDVDDKNYSTVSRIIKDAIEDGCIKPFDADNKAKKYAKYIPFWS